MDSCRLCYGEISLETCKNIFFSQQNHPPLSVLVAKFANLEINKNDPYSKNVCVLCYTKLINFHRFRQVILETNSILHQLSNCISTDSIVKIEESLDDGIKFEIDDDVSAENTERESIENLEETQTDEIIEDSSISNDDLAIQENPSDHDNCNKLTKKARKRRIVSEPMTICHICGKTCIQRHIQDHIRIHTGEKPYKCDICDRKFTKKVNLISHRELHDTTRSYKCDHCNRTFSQARNLRKHFRIHTGERPYTCNVCGKTFVWKYSLTVHIKKHCDKL